MKFEKLDSRRMRVTDIPSSVDGIRLGIQEMEVIVAYSGDGSVRRGLAIDHCVMPLILAAAELVEALAPFADLIENADDFPDGLHQWTVDTADVRRAKRAIAQATEQEVNA